MVLYLSLVFRCPGNCTSYSRDRFLLRIAIAPLFVIIEERRSASGPRTGRTKKNCLEGSRPNVRGGWVPREKRLLEIIFIVRARKGEKYRA